MDTSYLIPQIPLGVQDRDKLERRRLEQLAILQDYANTGNLKTSLADADRAMSSHYRWMKDDPAYQQAYEKVRRYLGDKLEGAVYERALNGTEKLITYEGQITGSYQEYDVRREALMLKGFKPEVYSRTELAALSDGVNPERIICAEFSVRLPAEKQAGKESGEGVSDSVDHSIQALPAPSADVPTERD